MWVIVFWFITASSRCVSSLSFLVRCAFVTWETVFIKQDFSCFQWMAPPERACLSLSQRGSSWLRSGVRKPRASKWPLIIFIWTCVDMLRATKKWTDLFCMCVHVSTEWIMLLCMSAAWVLKIPKTWWVALICEQKTWHTRGIVSVFHEVWLLIIIRQAWSHWGS